MLALMPQPVPTPSDMQFYPGATAVSKDSYNNCTTPRSASLKRPKLSLDTSRVSSTIGSRSTSLRLETLSVTDTTSRNTFSNAWEVDPSAASKPRKPLLMINPSGIHYSPSSESSYNYTTTPADSTTASSSPTTTSSPSSTTYAATDSSSSSPDYTAQPPYHLPFTTTSILLNGPLPRKRKRSPQPIFPSTKHVSFRTELTEDIVTKTYVFAHSDIEIDAIASNVPESRLAIRRALSRPTTTLCIPKTVVETTVEVPVALSGDLDDVDADADDDNDNDKCPVTPVAGRRKRRREWVWTLGPVSS